MSMYETINNKTLSYQAFFGPVLRSCSSFFSFVEHAERRTLTGRGYQVLRRSASVREHFGGLGSLQKNILRDAVLLLVHGPTT